MDHSFFTPKVKIVVVGCEGAGKTELSCSLTGRKLPSDTTLKLRTTTSKIGDVALSVCDTPGLKICTDDPSMIDKALKRISVLKECSAWIYTINMVEKNKFEKNDDNLAIMRNISNTFGETVWSKAIIVLTKADISIDLLQEMYSVKDTKEKFEAKIKEWTDRLHDYLESEVKLSKEVSSLVPVVASGLDHKDIDSIGMPWSNNVLLSLLLVAEHESQHSIIRLLFHDPKLCGKQIVSFLKNHRVIYKHRVLELRSNLQSERKQLVGLACSFLHSQEFMLQYCAKSPDNLSLRRSLKDDKSLEHWHDMSHSVNIVVLGSCTSGKTALINSLFYGKAFLNEELGTSAVSWNCIEQNELVCRVCDTPGLDSENYSDIIQQIIGDIGMLFFCFQITDDKSFIESIIRTITATFGPDIWKSAIVILTKANTFDPWLDYTAEIDRLTSFVKGIFEKLEVSISIVPAGYHKDVYIEGNPEQTVWFINLWMKVISVMPLKYQSMLITWLNSNTTLRKNWNKLSSKSSQVISLAYQNMLIELVNIISANLYPS